MNACLTLAAKGECKFGSTCRFSHDPWVVDQLPLFHGRLPCPDMVRDGRCAVHNCPHAHELRSFAEFGRAVLRVQRTRVREQYDPTSEQRGHQNGSSHGNDGNRSRHSSDDASAPNKRKRHDMPPDGTRHGVSSGASASVVTASGANNHGTVAAVEKRSSHTAASRAPCLWFATFGCRKGDHCPALHNAELVPQINGKYPCPRQVFGHCTSRDHCPFSHTINGIESFIALCNESGACVPEAKRVGGGDGRALSSDRDDHDDEISEDGKEYPQITFSGAGGAPGEMLYERFSPICMLGKGVYAKVVLAFDNVAQTMVALKMFRGTDVYRQAADDEARILTKLQVNSGGNDYCFVKFTAFIAGPYPHHALVFPVCGPSLLEVFKANARVWRHVCPKAVQPSAAVLLGATTRGLPLPTVRSILYQLLRFVCFAHSQGIIHTDLKPENICLSSSIPLLRSANGVVVPPHNGVSVIDFGNAVELQSTGFAPERCDVQTRHYRAPEVVVDCLYSFAIDVWSLGVLVPELLTGVTLFMTHDNLEHLALMERCIGPFGPPSSIPTLAAGRRFSRYFDDRNNTVAVRWPPSSASSRNIQYVRSSTTLWDVLDACGTPELKDLVQRMVCFEPSHRITAAEALEHPFFTAFH